MTYEKDMLRLHDANVRALSYALLEAGGEPTIILNNEGLANLLHSLAQNKIVLTAKYTGAKNERATT